MDEMRDLFSEWNKKQAKMSQKQDFKNKNGDLDQEVSKDELDTKNSDDSHDLIGILNIHI